MIAKVHAVPLDRTTGAARARRLYAIQTAPLGRRYIVALAAANGHYTYGAPVQVQLSLVGTEYARLYDPAGDLARGGPPTVDDLPQGRDTLSAFLAFWELATETQRADLWLHDKAIEGGRHDYCMTPMDRELPNRHKWIAHDLDETPRELEAAPVGGDWVRIRTRDLVRALKGTRRVVRIGTTTVKPAILRQLAKIHGPAIELRDHPIGLGFRSADQRHRCTVYHGAGDKYAGRNGFEAIVTWNTQAAPAIAAD